MSDNAVGSRPRWLRWLPTKNGCLRFAFRFAAYFGAVFILSLFDLLGIDSVTRNHSTVISNRVFGDVRPSSDEMAPPNDEGAVAPAASGALGVSVILIREKTLRNSALSGNDVTWPLSLGLHADLLAKIRSYEPRAVVLDIMFKDRREKDQVRRLNGEIARYRGNEGAHGGTSADGEIPLFFAVDEDRILRSDIEGVASNRKVHINLEIRDRRFLPGYFLQYPAKAKGKDGLLHPTAAFTVYNATNGDASDLPINPEPGAQDVVLAWDRGVAPLNRFWRRCDREYAWFGARILLALVDPIALKQACAPFPTAPAEVLFGAWDQDRLSRLIRRRIVYYATDLAGTGDHIYSPVHGRLPGVFAHAMAHQNLIDFGPDYKKRTEVLDKRLLVGVPLVPTELLVSFFEGIPVGAPAVEIITLCALILLMLCLFWNHLESGEAQRAANAPNRESEAGSTNAGSIISSFLLVRYVFFLCVSGLIVAGVTYSSFRHLNILTVNWIQCLGFITAVGGFGANRTVDKRLSAMFRVMGYPTTPPSENTVLEPSESTTDNGGEAKPSEQTEASNGNPNHVRGVSGSDDEPNHSRASEV